MGLETSFHIHRYRQRRLGFCPIMPKIANPCKHHGVYPVPGMFCGGRRIIPRGGCLQIEGPLPQPGEFYLSELDTGEWNEKNPKAENDQGELPKRDISKVEVPVRDAGLTGATVNLLSMEGLRFCAAKNMGNWALADSAKCLSMTGLRLYAIK